MNKTIHSEANEALCSALISARKKACLTQTALAKRLECPQSFVAKVENGERRLDVVEFVRYARALGKDPANLLGKLQKNETVWL
jgi:transcriptional regulator with XRE-family HTH domain